MFCPFCGKKYADASRFCWTCEKYLPKIKPVPPQSLLEERQLERDLPDDVLFAQIPKPEGEISDAEMPVSEAETLVDERRDENSQEHLNLIFEDAEHILDEILVEQKTDEPDESQPIIKPSEPYQ
jgi:hypothetical protein